jgi:hypothetical protein
MTRSVTFGGQTQFRPGGITRINANGLIPVGISANGTLAILGEAEGGEPRSVITVDDPSIARDLFRSGPLADAIRIAFDPSSDPRVPGGAFRALLYKTNNSTKSETQLPSNEAIFADTAAGVPTTTVIQLTTNTAMVVDEHVGRWFEIVATGEIRRIIGNTVDTITVSPGFSAAPVATDPVRILASALLLQSRDWGAHTNSVAAEFEPGVTLGTNVMTLTFEDKVEQSPELGGDPLFRIKYLGGPIVETGTANTITAGVPFDPTGATLEVLPAGGAPALNAWAGQMIRFSNGIQREISGNTAASPSVVTLAAGHFLRTDEQAEVDDDAGVSIVDVTSATATITGANGVATGLTSAILPTADDLALTFIAGETLRQFADRINGSTNYELEVANGVNQDTVLMAELDFGTAATAVDVRFDESQTATTGGEFLADLQAIIDWVNEFSELAIASRSVAGATEGSEPPQPTGGSSALISDLPVFFIGGTRGVSGNSDFQDGFDALAQFRANHTIPLISDDLINEGFGSEATFASVAAQLAEHVNLMNSTGKNEMGGYIGCDCTREELVTQSAAFNNADVQLFGQKLTVLNAAGSLQEQPEWSIAVAAAGMRAGVPEVGEPLTFKFIKTNGLSQDSSWDPRAIGDANRLLDKGVMFAEQVEGTGFRFVRDITTYLLDANIAFLDGNTRDAVRFIAYDLRTGIENQFTGLKATPANAASIRSFVISKMDIYRRENIIVQSLDPETETELLPGWRNLVVSITGNVATIRIEIFPVTGIVFQLNDIYLQIPRIVA